VLSGPGLRLPPGGGAPGYQARQYSPGCPGQPQNYGFWPGSKSGQGQGSGFHLRHGGGIPLLHVTRAGEKLSPESQDRPLFPGGGAVSAAHRAPAVPGQESGGPGVQDRQYGASLHLRPESGLAGRSGPHSHQSPGKGPVQPLSQRGGIRQGSGGGALPDLGGGRYGPGSGPL